MESGAVEKNSAPPSGPLLRVPAWAHQPRVWLAGWWVWFGVLFILSSIPGHEMPDQPFRFFDKIEHTGYFFGGGGLLGGWLILTGRWPARRWLLPLTAAAVGAFDEIHQLFTPGRSSGVDDWIADVLGGFLAMAAIRWVAARKILAPPAATVPE